MVNLDDLYKDRKLRKIAPDLNKSNQSIKISQKKLIESRHLLNARFYEQAILSAYTSMFHMARALLYKEGVQEKSHYAVYIYLKEKYSKSISAGLLESFLSHQMERKDILYGFDYSVDETEASSCVEDAEAFFNKLKEFLE